jgi:hypothetical protein
MNRNSPLSLWERDRVNRNSPLSLWERDRVRADRKKTYWSLQICNWSFVIEGEKSVCNDK